MTKKLLLKLARSIHWISSAFCFFLLLLFAITGVTLNHPTWFNADTNSQEKTMVLDKEEHEALQLASEEQRLQLAYRWVDEHLSLPLAKRIEQDDVEIIFDYPSPGGYQLVIFDTEAGEVIHEQHSNGLISFFNDLHKGRNSGLVWSWVIDISALLILIFSITGLALLYQHAKRRPFTWPLVVIGIVLPIAIISIFVP